MTAVYIESSAVLAWLFGESKSEEVIATLANASVIFSSKLTCLEVRRAIIRAREARAVTEQEALLLAEMFTEASLSWNLIDISDAVLNRASRLFTTEPVRSLDAIHLASLVLLAAERDRIAVLSFDARILQNLRAIGVITANAS